MADTDGVSCHDNCGAGIILPVGLSFLYINKAIVPSSFNKYTGMPPFVSNTYMSVYTSVSGMQIIFYILCAIK